MGQEFFRKYSDIIGEATRGVFNNADNAIVRPANQAERDMLAKGIKSARTYNKDMNAYTDQPIDNTGGVAGQTRGDNKSYGTTSSQIPNPEGAASAAYQSRPNVGMPANIRSDGGGSWQTGAVDTRAVNTGVPGAPVSQNDIRPNQGKATAIKKPAQPW